MTTRPLAVLVVAAAIGAGCAVAPEPEWRAAESRAFQQSAARRAALPSAARAALDESDRAIAAARTPEAVDSLGATLDGCRSAWRTRVALLGSADLATAEAALALAEAEFSVAHVRASDSLAEVARASFVALLGPRHPRVADAEALLGRLVKNFTGRIGFPEALDHYRTALQIRVETEGPRSLSAAATLHDLGNLYRLAAHYDEAFACFEAALGIRRSRLGPSHDDVAATLSAMAFLRAGDGAWAEAEVLATQAVAATPIGPGTPAGPRSMRLGLRGQMLRRLGRSSEALVALREAAALRESLWVHSPRDEGSSVMAGLSLYRDIALALADLGRSNEAFEQLERAHARSLSFRLLRPGEREQDLWRDLLARVQRSLAPDEALLTWPRTSTTLFVADYPIQACVVRATGPVRWIRLDRRTPPFVHLGTIREALWTELRATSGWPRRVLDAAPIEKLAQQMGEEWFVPLEPALEGVRRLVVSSPDFVAGGPLGVMRDGGGRWLGERYAISYTPSALLFARTRERARPSERWTRPALLVGDPDYPDRDTVRWARLSASASEFRQLAQRLPASTLLTGADARAARLRDLATSGTLAGFGIVHIAAHAEIDMRRSLESALVLAPDVRGGAASSRLVAREIAADWRLDADLVCLAACRTVAGPRSPTEGLLGIHQAFLAAGARALLVTLWSVDDDATGQLMHAFYERLMDRARPVGAAEALREAQASLRDWRAPDGSRPYAHPAYWAGFALIGDPS